MLADPDEYLQMILEESGTMPALTSLEQCDLRDVGVLGLAVVDLLEPGDIAGKRREVGRDPLVDGAPLELALDLRVVAGSLGHSLTSRTV